MILFFIFSVELGYTGNPRWHNGKKKKKKIQLSMLETQETQVRSLGQEDPLEEGIAPHSSSLAWRIPWPEEPGRLEPLGRNKSDMAEQLSMHTNRQ